MFHCIECIRECEDIALFLPDCEERKQARLTPDCEHPPNHPRIDVLVTHTKVVTFFLLCQHVPSCALQWFPGHSFLFEEEPANI